MDGKEVGSVLNYPTHLSWCRWKFTNGFWASYYLEETLDLKGKLLFKQLTCMSDTKLQDKNQTKQDD